MCIWHRMIALFTFTGVYSYYVLATVSKVTKNNCHFVKADFI